MSTAAMSRFAPAMRANVARVAFTRAAAGSAAGAVPRLTTMATSTTRRAFSSNASKPPVWRVDNPYTGEIVAEVPTLTSAEAVARVEAAEATFRSWKSTPLKQRIALVEKWCDALAAEKERVALDITRQMGKPLGQARGEVDTAIKRARALVALAGPELAEEAITPAGDVNPALLRKITKEPIGVVLALVPWNYPLLCAVNTVVAATLTGCPVLLKHSDRTPLVADVFERTFLAAGAPKGLVQAFHIDHAETARIVEHPAIKFVQFTGSVAGGRAVYSTAAAKRFIDVGLELGGKDPAYVAADADLQNAIDNVTDGALYNAGQSCCAVERAYVHESQYDAFLAGAQKLFNSYKLGDPTQDSTTLGPVAQPHHIAFLEAQVAEAEKKGARILTGGKAVKDASGKGRFFAPTLIADATHDMRVVSEESFGPILAVTKVKDDEEAIRLMNDSQYGLTASIWTRDLGRAQRIASELDAGTVYMNRCDFLDPYLAWSGRKDSGKGIGLSSHGFAPFYRTKSYNFKPANM